MGRSEGTSPAPDDFVPERHLDGSETVDPYSYVFGFGRRCAIVYCVSGLDKLIAVCRVCPGRHLADNALFMMITSILSCFTISPKPTSLNDAPGVGDRKQLVEPVFSKHLIRYLCKTV